MDSGCEHLAARMCARMIVPALFGVGGVVGVFFVVDVQFLILFCVVSV